MKKTLFNALFIISLSANVSVLSILGWSYYKRASMRPEDPSFTWRKRPLERVLNEELGLRGDEIIQLKKIIREHTQDIHNQHRKIRGLRHELRAVLSEPEPDRKTLNMTLEEFNKQQGSLNVMLVNRLLDIKDKLPEGAQGRWRRLLSRGLLQDRGSEQINGRINDAFEKGPRHGKRRKPGP